MDDSWKFILAYFAGGSMLILAIAFAEWLLK